MAIPGSTGNPLLPNPWGGIPLPLLWQIRIPYIPVGVTFCMEFAEKMGGSWTKAVVIMLVLLGIRTVVEYFGFDVVPINTVVGAFISGAIFHHCHYFHGDIHRLQRE